MGLNCWFTAEMLYEGQNVDNYCFRKELIYFICQNILGTVKEKERRNKQGEGRGNLARQDQLFYAHTTLRLIEF
jgi:hypothetical protein